MNIFGIHQEVIPLLLQDDSQRAPSPLSRKNPKKPRKGFVAHDFGYKV